MNTSPSTNYNLRSSVQKEPITPKPSYAELKGRVQHQKDVNCINRLKRKIAKLESQLSTQREQIDVLKWQTDAQHQILAQRLPPNMKRFASSRHVAMTVRDSVQPNTVHRLMIIRHEN